MTQDVSCHAEHSGSDAVESYFVVVVDIVVHQVESLLVMLAEARTFFVLEHDAYVVERIDFERFLNELLLLVVVIDVMVKV